MSNSQYFIGSAAVSLDQEESRIRLVQRLRQYLEVRHLSLLLGNGASIPLGSPLVNSVHAIRAELAAPEYALADSTKQGLALGLVDKILARKPNIAVEPLLAGLINARANIDLLDSIQHVNGHGITQTEALALESLVKKWLFRRCKALSAVSDDHIRDHEELLRRVMLRSTTLPRAKVFTTNYDLVLERALDNLGVMYFDGFLGTVNRTLRTESYHYDLYFPGDTTEGRVSRVDRVLHLYKLHGSINWRRRRTEPDDVVINNAEPSEGEYGDVMVYPSPLKVSEMNGYPYAEMFRHFSGSLHQPQSALITIGYGFQDDHINRLIYQALSVPSFTLIIVIPNIYAPTDASKPGPEHEIWRLIHQLNSNRILVVTGGEKDSSGAYAKGAGTFHDFATTLLPDISELNVEASAREETRKALAPLEPGAL